MSELRRAARAGDVEELRALLAGGEVDVDARSPPPSGATPLFCAAAGGSADCVRELLRHGADWTLTAREATPVMAAARKGHAEALAALLEAGARADTVRDRGDDALTMAIVGGHARCVELLVRAPGVDVNKDRTIRGEWVPRSPLRLCVACGDAATLRALLTAEALRWDHRPVGPRRRTCTGSVKLRNVLEAAVMLGWEHGLDALLQWQPAPPPPSRSYRLPWLPPAFPPPVHPLAGAPWDRPALAVRIALSPFASGQLSKEVVSSLTYMLRGLRVCPARRPQWERSHSTLRMGFTISSIVGVLLAVSDGDFLDAFLAARGPLLGDAVAEELEWALTSPKAVDPELANTLLQAVVPGTLPCARALEIARAAAFPPSVSAPLSSHALRAFRSLELVNDARVAAFVRAGLAWDGVDADLARGVRSRELSGAIQAVVRREQRLRWAVLLRGRHRLPGAVGWLAQAPRRVQREVLGWL